MPQDSVETVHSDDEWQLSLFEVVHGRETVGEPPGVGENDGTDSAPHDVVPHEPEPVLSRRAEQIEDQILVQGDPAEVHCDRGRRLVGEVGQVVDVCPGLGHDRLGPQGYDLGHRTDKSRLAGAETTSNDDLDRSSGDGGVDPSAVRACEGH